MSRLDRLTSTAAVGASRDLLIELTARHGQVGDMVSTMAHSPPHCSDAISSSTGI